MRDYMNPEWFMELSPHPLPSPIATKAKRCAYMSPSIFEKLHIDVNVRIVNTD